MTARGRRGEMCVAEGRARPGTDMHSEVRLVDARRPASRSIDGGRAQRSASLLVEAPHDLCDLRNARKVSPVGFFRFFHATRYAGQPLGQ